ncbi:hypothetical protein Tco_1208170 [Tanacetum coccineum]
MQISFLFHLLSSDVDGVIHCSWLADSSTSMIEIVQSLRMALSWWGVYSNATMEAFPAEWVKAACILAGITTRFVLAAMAGWHDLLSCYPLANLSQPFSRCDEWDV